MILDPDSFRRNLLEYTNLAFSSLPKLDKATVLDAGCGTGEPTVRLAELCNGWVVGIDIDRIALGRLAEKVAEKRFSRRVMLVNCPIERMPFAREVFDVVWAEGSISHLGFKNAMGILGQHLKRKGYLVLHDDAEGYREKIRTVGSLDFSLLRFFLLSESIWWDKYYKHLNSTLQSADSACPPHSLAVISRELEQFKNEPKRFRSAFFIMRKD